MIKVGKIEAISNNEYEIVKQCDNEHEVYINFTEQERLKLIEDLKAIGKKVKKPFVSHRAELETLATSQRKALRIIAQYAVEKNITFYSKAQVNEFVSRNVKAATILEGLPGERILRTIEYLKKNVDFKWTLETVVKYAEDIDNLSPKKSVGLGEFIISKN
jgi:hypothetical protein